MKSISIFILMWLTLLSSSLYADDYYQFKYKVMPGDTLESILRFFLKPNSIVNAKTPMILKLQKLNPHISNWRHLTPGSQFLLYIDKTILDLERYKEYEAKRLEELEEKIADKKIFPEGLKGSIFYMASVGMFTQETPSVGTLEFNQNSPVTLGTSFTYYPKGKPFSTNINGYYSHLTAASTNINSSSYSIPPEIGFALFEEYRYDKWRTTFYAGPDYEKFTTFNLSEATTTGELYLDESSVIYLTAGASRLFTLFNKNWFFKSSLSFIVSSSTTTNAPATSDAAASSEGTSYSGYKALFYVNYKFSDRLYLHSLFKYHSMSGPTDVTTLRIGVGFGYILF